MTLIEIKEHMLNYIGNDTYNDDNYYDEDGHCGSLKNN